ncbi:Gfo/Idh/MocA family oxidoreductase [Tumebacillus sp. DT12]|uniref:Gfo/Idh/MocA family oxidoreductase n=1 Tax=Tumebacillus lacus TaxID=2995335 RepID=A0ABT3X2E8_9BACL|nr:Gfo/Idh/MocA family oxidoreductase [Tumebacillus lacus]MCX7570128.1 Gfo/Idh/MocA family oxidoreductase [Tumebacillus lacus]
MTRVGVIGAGQWGKNLVRTFDEIGVLTAVAESSPVIRERIGREFPAAALYENARALIGSGAVEAVAIATPVPTHFTLAKEALTAGLDVFVEKPITLTTGEAEELHRLALERERVLMVGHLLLYQPAIGVVKRLLESGEIGELRALYQKRLKLGRVRSVENVLWSFGVHDLAVLLHLVGSEPERVTAHGQRMLQPGVEDDVHLHLGWSGGVQAHLHTSWLWPEQERKLTVVGSLGMLVYDELRQTVTHFKKGVRGDLSQYDDGSAVVCSGTGEPLRIECEHFLACVSERKQPLSDGANGVAVLRVLERATAGWKEAGPG